MHRTAFRSLAMAAGWLAAAVSSGLPAPATAQPAAGQPSSIYAPGHSQEWSTRSGPPVVVAPPAAGTLFGPSYGSAPSYPGAAGSYYQHNQPPGLGRSLAPNVVPGWAGQPPSGPVMNPYPPPPVHRGNGSTYYRR